VDNKMSHTYFSINFVLHFTIIFLSKWKVNRKYYWSAFCVTIYLFIFWIFLSYFYSFFTKLSSSAREITDFFNLL